MFVNRIDNGKKGIVLVAVLLILFGLAQLLYWCVPVDKNQTDDPNEPQHESASTTTLGNGILWSENSEQILTLDYICSFIGIDDEDTLSAEESDFSVAIIDTGVFPHESLDNRIVAFKDFLYDKKLPYDDAGHGTQIAGIIAALGDENIGNGIAPFVNIVSAKALDYKCQGRTKNVIQALSWVIDNSELYRVRIINLSIGFQYGTHDEIEALFAEAASKNIFIVSSVGNASDIALYSGIQSDDIILVGSVESNGDDNTFVIADYSQEIRMESGQYRPDIYTFGSRIRTIDSNVLYKGNQNEEIHYRDKNTVVSGSSYSAAIVTGYLCRLISEEPSLTCDQLKSRLLDSDLFVFSRNGAEQIPMLGGR